MVLVNELLLETLEPFVSASIGRAEGLCGGEGDMGALGPLVHVVLDLDGGRGPEWPGGRLGLRDVVGSGRRTRRETLARRRPAAAVR